MDLIGTSSGPEVEVQWISNGPQFRAILLNKFSDPVEVHWRSTGGPLEVHCRSTVKFMGRQNEELPVDLQWSSNELPLDLVFSFFNSRPLLCRVCPKDGIFISFQYTYVANSNNLFMPKKRSGIG